jgi:aminoglycoside phosphotransferase
MRGVHLSDETRSTIARTGSLGRAWLEELDREGSSDRAELTRATTDVVEVEVLVAHSERVTLRVGDAFVKLDTDRSRLDAEVKAMALAPVPTAAVLWRKPFELGLAPVPGTAIARLGEPSIASPAAWAAAGAAIRTLHDAPLPPWSAPSLDELTAHLDAECEWLLTNDVVPAGVITRNRRRAEAALQPREQVFVHGDLQVAHVFVDGDEVTGIIDWSDGRPGDALFDLAILTLGHPEHLDDVIAGYGTDVDLDLIRGWWSFRCLESIRWLDEHGYGPVDEMPEVAVLRSQP